MMELLKMLGTFQTTIRYDTTAKKGRFFSRDDIECVVRKDKCTDSQRQMSIKRTQEQHWENHPMRYD